MRFGAFARDRRIARRVSMRHVARELRLSSSYVSDIELGLRNPPAEPVVRRWAQLIDEDPDQLVKIARNDTEKVVISVDRDPQRAEFATLVARRLPEMTDEQIKEVTKMLRGDSDE